MTALRARPARAVAVAVLALALAALAWLALGLIRGTGGPPAAGAQRLVPADALVFVDLSTDTGRRAVRDMAELAGEFDAYDRVTDQLLERLAGSGGGIDPEEDVRPWLGDQAAIALLDTGTGTAGSLVVVEVTDAKRANRFLARNQQASVQREYKGVRMDRYGEVSTAIVGDHLVVGQDPTVQAAIDRSQGNGRTLAEDPTYRRAVRALPEDRALSAYATGDGLDRLLVPQAGLLGTLSGLLAQPGLRGVAVSAQADDGDARVITHSIVRRRRFAQVEPTLPDDVPAGATAMLVQRGVTAALRRGFETTLAGTGALLDRLRADLDRRAGGRLERDLLGLLQGEVALVVTRGDDRVPAATLVARAPDEAATRRTLDRLRDPVARALRAGQDGQPRWSRGAGGAWTLRLPTGAALSYAVADGKLLLSTTEAGIAAVRTPERALAEADAYDAVLGSHPDWVGSLGFIDFRQLLELGEQTGLNEDRSYLAARDDLRRIGAVGISSTGTGEEATAEILLSIP